MDTSSDESLIGKTLGSYRIEARLGAGGMGEVYRALHVQLERPVAIKTLHPQIAADRSSVQRFFAEARAANLIRHENIVEYTDLVSEPDGRSYMVMELLEGRTVSQAIRDSGSLDPRRTVRIAAQIADALDAAHAKGIVHRDLKPDNVFLIRRMGMDDYVKVLDFGIARLRPELGAVEATRTGAIIGTPAYMSPEQVMGQKVTAAADIYALGVMLFKMLTGKLPFDGPTIPVLMMAHVSSEPPSVDTLSPAVPAGLSALVGRALAKQPADRPASMAAMRAAMLEAVGIDPAEMPGSGPSARTLPLGRAGAGPVHGDLATAPTFDGTGDGPGAGAGDVSGDGATGIADAGAGARPGQTRTMHGRPAAQAGPAAPTMAASPGARGGRDVAAGPGPGAAQVTAPARRPVMDAGAPTRDLLGGGAGPGAAVAAGMEGRARPEAQERGPFGSGAEDESRVEAQTRDPRGSGPGIAAAGAGITHNGAARAATPTPVPVVPGGPAASGRGRLVRGIVGAALAIGAVAGALAWLTNGGQGGPGDGGHAHPGDSSGHEAAHAMHGDPARAATDAGAAATGPADPDGPGEGMGQDMDPAVAGLRQRLDEATRGQGDPLPPRPCQTRDPALLTRLVQAATLLADGAPAGARDRDADALRVLDSDSDSDSAAVAADATGSEYWYWLAKARLYAGDGDVLEAAGRAVTLCADHAAAHSLGGTALFRAGRPDEAEAHYRKALALAPGFLHARFNLGLVQIQQDHTDEGLATLSDVIARDGSFTDAHLARSQAYLVTRQPERAAADLELVVQREPENAQAFFLLGQTYQLLGRAEDAERALCRSRDLGHPRAAERCPR